MITLKKKMLFVNAIPESLKYDISHSIKKLLNKTIVPYQIVNIASSFFNFVVATYRYQCH